METTQAGDHGFESVWESLRETDKMIKELSDCQEETGRLIMKNAKLIRKLGRQKRPDAHYIVRQLETMCYL